MAETPWSLQDGGTVPAPRPRPTPRPHILSRGEKSGRHLQSEGAGVEGDSLVGARALPRGRWCISSQEV